LSFQEFGAILAVLIDEPNAIIVLGILVASKQKVAVVSEKCRGTLGVDSGLTFQQPPTVFAKTGGELGRELRLGLVNKGYNKQKELR
jgi:hypothetical protein